MRSRLVPGYGRSVRILMLGAGFGGLELTARLSAEFGDSVEIVLIDQNDSFVFGFSKLDVMFGRAAGSWVRHAYSEIVKPGVQFVQATVRSIDPAAKRVETDAGPFQGDAMVVGLGADLDIAATPGLAEAGHEFYTSMAPSPRKMCSRASRAATSSSGSSRRRTNARRLQARRRCSCTTSSWIEGSGPQHDLAGRRLPAPDPAVPRRVGGVADGVRRARNRMAPPTRGV